MPWDIVQLEDESKYVRLGENDMPLFIPEEEGEENTPVEVDWTAALTTISRLNGENKERREAAETLASEKAELTKQIETWGDLDPAKAKEALDKLKNIDQGDLMTADKVESFKESILKAADDERQRLVQEYDGQLDELKGSLAEKEQEIYSLVITNAFKGSEYLKEKIVVPLEMVENYFGPYFKVESGAPVGYLNGNKINSRQRPGETATFDEAISIIIEQYPAKNSLFKGVGAGSGSQGGGGSGSTFSAEQIKGMTLKEYEKAKKEGRVPKIA